MINNKIKHAVWIISSALIITSFFCGGEKETNTQPVDQYNLDNSNDYKYIFEDIIKKNKEKEEKYRKGPFDE